jgi:chromosomal replication initiator protein
MTTILPSPDWLALTGKVFGVAPYLLNSETRQHHVTEARQALTWVLRQRDWSYYRIGELLGGRNHTTIIYHMEVAERLYRDDPGFRNLVQALIREIDGEPIEAAPQQACTCGCAARLAELEARLARLEARMG